MPVQIIASLAILIFLFKVWSRYREQNIPFSQALLWSLLGLGTGIIFWQPEIASRLALFLGIGRGADLIVYIAILVLAYITFRIFIKIDKIDRQISKIVKEIALDEEKKSRHTDR